MGNTKLTTDINNSDNDKIMVACYRRVSTKNAEQTVSFENQGQRLSDFVENSSNYTLFDMYEDEGISGTKLFHRKDFTRMLIDAGLSVNNEKKVIFDEKLQKWRTILHFSVYEGGAIPKFDRILVKDTSRFARNINVMTIIDELAKKKVFVDFLDVGLTSEKVNDIAVLGIFVNNDALYSRNLSRTVSDGNLASEKNGILRTNHKLYGYTYVPRGKNKTINNRIEIIESEAIVVRTIFRLYNGCYDYFTDGEVMLECDFNCDVCPKRYSQGAGIRVILKVLKLLGYKTRDGKDFAQTVIKQKLSNEKYAGYVNTRKYNHGTVFAKTTYPKPRENYTTKYDTSAIEPIISTELFYLCKDKCNSRAGDTRGKFIGTHTKYKGKLICGICGNTYIHNVSKKYAEPVGYYVCKIKKRQGSDICKSVVVYDKEIDAFIKAQCDGGLNDEINTENKSVFSIIYSKIMLHIYKIKSNEHPDIDSLRKNISDKTKYLANMLKLAAQDEEYDNSLAESMEEASTEIKSLRSDLNAYLTPVTAYFSELDRLLKICEAILNLMITQKDIYTESEYWGIVKDITVHGSYSIGGKKSSIHLSPNFIAYVPVEKQLNLDEHDMSLSLTKIGPGQDMSVIRNLTIPELIKLMSDANKSVEELKLKYL